MSSLRLLIVAEDPLARAGLAAALASEPEVDVVGRRGPSDEIVARVAAFAPDVVLFDLGWEGSRGGVAPDALADLIDAGRTVVAMVAEAGQAWRTMGGGQIDRYLQTDTAMYPGFSGGPLVDAAGRVLGINSSALLRGISLTVPVATVRRLVETLLAHGHVPRGHLGVKVQPVRLPAAIASGVGQETGVLLLSVEAGSPAERAGLLLGDTIVALDGQPVRDIDDLMALLSGDRVGSAAPVRVLRGGEVRDLTVTIGDRG